MSAQELLQAAAAGLVVGDIVIEGKTKIVAKLPSEEGNVLVVSKDRITAGDGARSNEIAGKSAVSNRTTCHLFEYLNEVGVPTHFVRAHGDTSFVARSCAMVPIEFVTRRLAYGSYLRRFKEPFAVQEAYRFEEPCLEFFFKDDAAHDPQVTREQMLSGGLLINGQPLARATLDRMCALSVVVFELLERAWALQGCSLVDMKVEFGLGPDGTVLLADVVDNDAWRVWPQGDKRLMQDKQFYRELKEVTPEALQAVLKKYEWVEEAVAKFKQAAELAVHVVGDVAPPLAAALARLGLRAQRLDCNPQVPSTVLAAVRRLASGPPTCVILGPASAYAEQESLAPVVVLEEGAHEAAAVRAARALASVSHIVWGRLRTQMALSSS